jgi:hypothetical protein
VQSLADVSALGYSRAIEEFLAVRHIELSQKSEGKILTIDLAAQRHR